MMRSVLGLKRLSPAVKRVRGVLWLSMSLCEIYPLYRRINIVTRTQLEHILDTLT